MRVLSVEQQRDGGPYHTLGILPARSSLAPQSAQGGRGAGGQRQCNAKPCPRMLSAPQADPLQSGKELYKPRPASGQRGRTAVAPRRDCGESTRSDIRIADAAIAADGGRMAEPSPDSVSAGAPGSLIRLMADVTTTCAPSIFDGPLASLRDADASDRDLTFVHSHGLSTRRGESIAD